MITLTVLPTRNKYNNWPWLTLNTGKNTESQVECTENTTTDSDDEDMDDETKEGLTVTIDRPPTQVIPG